MRIEKKLWIALIVFGLFAVGFTGWIFNRSMGGERVSFNNTVRLETEADTAGEIKTKNLVLPEEFDIPRSLLFKTTHTSVQILLDGEEIYQYGHEENAPKFMKSPGSCWHIADIPKNSAGKELEIRILPAYSGYYGNNISLYLGTRGDCILRILSDSLGIFIISCGILFTGLVSLLLYFFAIKSKRKTKVEGKNEIFLNLGIFSVLIALWSLQQCGFLQFLIPDGRTLYYVDLFTFYLFPIPFNFLVYDICSSKYRKGALYFPVLYLVDMTVSVILQCAGIVDMFQLLPVTHVLMICNVIYTFVLIHYEARVEENESAREFTYPLYIVLGFGVAELILYYARHFKTTSIFLPLGTMGFIIVLIWIQVSRFYDQYVEKQKVLYLLKVANTDMLTEAMNRNAYEHTIRQLDEQASQLQKTGVVLFDLDNLKVINDNFGHEKGDEALKLCYNCIRQVFKEAQNCFRIGGDEFAYVYHNDEKDLIADRIKRLDILLEEAAKKVSYPLSVSTGYAYYLPDEDRAFKDIAKRSDIMLYRRKRRKKLNRACMDTAAAGMEKMLAQENAEDIFQEKEYQDITPEELCKVIDLLSPSTDNYLYLIDFRTDFYYIAPQAMERFSIPKNAFHDVMECHREFVYGPDYPLLKAEFKDLLSTDRSIHNMEYRWLDPKREPIWINCRGYVVRDENMKPLYMVGCINEIGARQKADNVSGLLGETGLREYLKKLKPPFENGYLIRLGLDHFKEINENLGWEYGDQVLRETAVCISGCMSENQPVFRSETGKLYGAEALMRFISEKFGMVSPAEFIPILEETGLIIPAGRWMMGEAMGKCSQIREVLPEFLVSINISQVQAAKSDVILDVIAAMEKAKLPADALIIELTESDLLEQNINERHFLTELQRMKIKLALDDFGTGYSNFHYLSELGPAIIKIDRSFTASAVADEGEYYLLNQFCSMIHNLNLKLCIEGVENKEEWSKIRNLQPDFSQGFFWGRPCPYEEFVEKFVEK